MLNQVTKRVEHLLGELDWAAVGARYQPPLRGVQTKVAEFLDAVSVLVVVYSPDHSV